MCFQLFAKRFAAKGEAIRREGSGGDAAMEGYIADTSGRVIIGLQTKFFADKFGPVQWRQIDNSVDTALNDNREDRSLQSYVIATPRNFNKQQYSKWRKHQQQWSTLAKKLGYAPIPKFVHWDCSFLELLLKESQNRGQLLYWFDYPDFDSDRCAQLSSETIKQLGDRYIPGLHTPTECEDTIHIFLRTERFRQRYIEATRKALGNEHEGELPTEAQWPAELKRLLASCRTLWGKIVEELSNTLAFPPSFDGLGKAVDAYHQQSCELCRALQEHVRQQKVPSQNEGGYRKATPIEEDYHALSHNGNAFDLYAQEVRSKYVLADSHCLLVSGQAGTGKSHTLAELCSRYKDAGGAVLFLDGRQLPTDDPPWSQFLEWVDFSRGGIREFLSCFSAIAQTTSLPGLICIDALNECPNRNIWRNGLETFAAEIRPYPNLKLLVSCRTDYLDLTVPDSICMEKATGWRHIKHEGLGLNVFKAVPKYLRAYRVRGASITPLTPEFSNPLMLKTYCEAFEDKCPPAGSQSLPQILKEPLNN